MSYDPAYYRAYYEARKEKILADKKHRYKTDVRYRGGLQQRARVSSLMRGLKRRELKKAARVMHNGKPEPFYYVSHMVSMCNRSRSVLDLWIKNDPSIIPKALYRDSRGRGVYSESQVRFVSATVHKLDSGKLAMTYPDLRNLFHDVWPLTFSDRLLTKAIREVLHGKHYVEGEGRKVRKGK